MARRKLTDAQLRDLVRSRLTRGDAFRQHQGPITYAIKQQQTAEELSKLSRKEILTKYPHYTYDVAQ